MSYGMRLEMFVWEKFIGKTNSVQIKVIWVMM